MKNFDGYLKKKLGNTYVLLSGGGLKSLGDFIGSLQWDNDNKKLQYKSASASDWSDLVTFGANAFKSTAYLPLSGGTMTGALELVGSCYNGYDGGTYGMNCNNSDIIGVNSILTSDLSDSWKESIGFKRSNGNWDTFRAADGTFYFGVNNGTEYTAIHSGNYTTYCAKASHTHSYLPLSGGTLSGSVTFSQNAGGTLNADLQGIYIQTGSYWLRATSSGCDYNGYNILNANNYTSYTVTKTGSGASGTWNINITGTSNYLTGYWDGAFHPGDLNNAIYSSWTGSYYKLVTGGGYKTLVDYADNSGYAAKSTYLYSDQSPYRVSDSAPYYAHIGYNINGVGNRWYLRMYPETPKDIAVDYAFSAGSATTAATATTATNLVDGSSRMTSAYNKAGLDYSSYTWLAGWNGYELRAVNKTQFATSGHNHDSTYLKKGGDTMTGTLNITSALFVINDSSNTTYDGLAYFRTYSNNDWGVIIDKNNGYSYGLDIRCNGDYGLRCSGHARFSNNVYAANFYTTSDSRKKKEIKKISSSIYQFKLKDLDTLLYGFIAQDLEVNHPELVESSGEYKTVNYNSALSYYVAQLENRVKELENEIKLLKEGKEAI